MELVTASNWINTAEEAFEAALRCAGTPKGAGFLGLALNYLSDITASDFPTQFRPRVEELAKRLNELMPGLKLSSIQKNDSYSSFVGNTVTRFDTTEEIAAAVNSAMDVHGTHSPALLPIVAASLNQLLNEFSGMDATQQVAANHLIRTLQSLLAQLPALGTDFGIGDSYQNDSAYGTAIAPNISYGAIGYDPFVCQQQAWSHQDSMALEQEYAISFQRYVHEQGGYQ
jgi:hypothetical protein